MLNLDPGSSKGKVVGIVDRGVLPVIVSANNTEFFKILQTKFTPSPPFPMLLVYAI